MLLDRVLDETLASLKAERAEGVDDNSAGYHQVMVADAFMEMVRSALEHGLPEGSDPNPVVLQVDIETLAGLQGEVANLERRIGIPKETVERYMCDCSVKSVLERDGDPLHVGRKYRSINSSIGSRSKHATSVAGGPAASGRAHCRRTTCGPG